MFLWLGQAMNSNGWNWTSNKCTKHQKTSWLCRNLCVSCTVCESCTNKKAQKRRRQKLMVPFLWDSEIITRLFPGSFHFLNFLFMQNGSSNLKCHVLLPCTQLLCVPFPFVSLCVLLWAFVSFCEVQVIYLAGKLELSLNKPSFPTFFFIMKIYLFCEYTYFV